MMIAASKSPSTRSARNARVASSFPVSGDTPARSRPITRYDDVFHFHWGRGKPPREVIGIHRSTRDNPTPVNPRNFQNPVLDDVLTSVVGPISNLVVATAATVLLVGIKLTSPAGRAAVYDPVHAQSALGPLCFLLFEFLEINVLLAVFNLIPIPPLDGSHVLRHFLPESIRQVYDMAGIFGLMAFIYFAPNLLSKLVDPVLRIFLVVLNA